MGEQESKTKKRGERYKLELFKHMLFLCMIWHFAKSRYIIFALTRQITVLLMNNYCIWWFMFYFDRLVVLVAQKLQQLSSDLSWMQALVRRIRRHRHRNSLDVASYFRLDEGSDGNITESAMNNFSPDKLEEIRQQMSLHRNNLLCACRYVICQPHPQPQAFPHFKNYYPEGVWVSSGVIEQFVR